MEDDQLTFLKFQIDFFLSQTMKWKQTGNDKINKTDIFYSIWNITRDLMWQNRLQIHLAGSWMD